MLGWTLVIGFVVALLVGGVVLLAGSLPGEDEEAAVATRPAARGEIPPIDAAAPADTETATFALG